MKNNYGISNILILLIIFFLGFTIFLGFQYPYSNKSEQNQLPKEKDKLILIKNEINNYSFYINDSITIDTINWYHATPHLFSSDKKIQKSSEITNNSKGDEISVVYTPNLIVPELKPEAFKFGGIISPCIAIKSYNKSFNSNSYLLEIGGEIIEENKNIEEKVINGFKSYKFYTPDFAGGGVSTVFVINENHYLTISYSEMGTDDKNKQVFYQLYSEILNSVKTINY